MQFQEWQFDKRVVERNLRRGLVQRQDYDKFLKTLPDLTEKTAPLVEDDGRKGGIKREPLADE